MASIIKGPKPLHELTKKFPIFASGFFSFPSFLSSFFCSSFTSDLSLTASSATLASMAGSGMVVGGSGDGLGLRRNPAMVRMPENEGDGLGLLEHRVILAASKAGFQES